MGKEKLEFLYGPSDQDDRIELRSGVAYCFRQFYSLIQDAVRSAWLRDVRALNGDMLGQTLDLREFLFGAERNAVRAVPPVLMDLQRGRCFYSSHTQVRSGVRHVDQFIPCAKIGGYAVDK